ncbi:MAG: hypothetical protein K2N03_00980 [Muribaculaceae bacterium]|nr:hypothetical protein [Muribaculaceae bacterium]
MHTYRTSHSAYSSDLTLEQAMLVRINIDGILSRLRKYRPEEIINAIAYVLVTLCPVSFR